jgi:hypothetical protein
MAMPRTRRPPDITSSIATSSASRTGWWNAATTMSVPRIMRDVRVAKPARTVSGEGQ